MKNFSNKVAAITGAGSGIGRALALQLADAGCAVAISDVNETGLAETAALLADKGVKVTQQRLDVADRAAVYAWADQVVAEHGQVNLIFNNAGVALAGSVAGTSIEDYEWIMNINFWGVVYGTKAFLPHLKASGDGHVINISSVFGLFSQPTQSGYNASKFAVRGFTESLRQELDLASHGVSASCVHPGGIKTNIARSARINASMKDLTGVDGEKSTAEFEKLFSTTADQAAATILKGVRKNARRILIGLDARAIDSFQRSLPANYQALLTGAFKLGRRLRS
ncbi:putative short-chain dehydrogenase [Oceanococcus atlanticus]|uniref:Putative short-chain dehydrogenase n=1 Tax=Oceanococcus atlanticus TaxID=1317117 RepID=A0A1Y1S9U4_9GAMM|nr:SDR family NAD(P)-dependent oxidoreductase [Oceanococcus atlanticus]ORE85037.1 putative short-chain dehydrogenase [Oceanococcus atlanticus]